MRVAGMRTIVAAAAAAAVLAPASASAYGPPPANAGFDYQIGGDYPLPAGVSVVSRDWFSGSPAPDPAYSICYVNAFQTQPDERGVDRPDERSSWPRRLVLDELGDDPNWGGEYLIDIRSARLRARAARWVAPMVGACADAGYEAVEFDNLDSWTRFNGTPLGREVPFGKRDALAYARLLAAGAHRHDLAVGQKNTAQLTRRQADRAGFDFAIAEECGRWRECGRYTDLYGDEVIVIEYRRRDFRRACERVGDRLSVVLRDRLVGTPQKRRYAYDSC
ncbi:MAG: hypothetical protein BroJett022_05970 [Actinomycetes bacterium]|nr:MAG: hypothetical protein BroJett022_05970 [Actinomycetes bacterium]